MAGPDMVIFGSVDSGEAFMDKIWKAGEAGGADYARKIIYLDWPLEFGLEDIPRLNLYIIRDRRAPQVGFCFADPADEGALLEKYRGGIDRAFIYRINYERATGLPFSRFYAFCVIAWLDAKRVRGPLYPYGEKLGLTQKKWDYYMSLMQVSELPIKPAGLTGGPPAKSPTALASDLMAHKRWLESGGAEGIRLDYSSRDARGLDFYSSDLNDAIFHRADLRNAEFSYAILDRVDFSEADLQGARFINAQGMDINFEGADLRNVNFNGAKVVRPEMDGAKRDSTTVGLVIKNPEDGMESNPVDAADVLQGLMDLGMTSREAANALDTMTDLELGKTLWYNEATKLTPEIYLRELDNKKIGGFGVESWWEGDDGELVARPPHILDKPVINVINTGDTYSLTVLFDHYEGSFAVTTWGDWVARWEKRRREENYETNKQNPRIKLENSDDDDGMVLATMSLDRAAEIAKEEFQSIEGSNWEGSGDFAYAYFPNRPDLVEDLEAEGYDVDDSEFTEYEEDDEDDI